MSGAHFCAFCSVFLTPDGSVHIGSSTEDALARRTRRLEWELGHPGEEYDGDDDELSWIDYISPMPEQFTYDPRLVSGADFFSQNAPMLVGCFWLDTKFPDNPRQAPMNAGIATYNLRY